jgi:hypothetical protein
MKMPEDEHNECVICFHKVDENNTHIKCCNCGKLYHKSCMDKWKLKKTDICYCPSCTKNDLLFHKYSFAYDFCCIKIKRKTAINKIYEYN